MSTSQRPPGRLPQSVYWRRRLVLLAVLVAIVVVIVLIVVRPGSGSKPVATHSSAPASPASTTPAAMATSPSGSVSGAPSGSATATIRACKASNVTLIPVTDALNYPAGAQPKISMSIENTGSSPCSIDAGTDAQEYLISSGAERIWDSKDCQQQPAKNLITLEPGKTVSTTPFAWDRTHSSTTTCSATRAPAIAGGASYHLTVLLGSITSATTKQFALE